MRKITQRITPFLWFDDQAEEAARFYVSIFEHSRIGRVARDSEQAARTAGRPVGSVMTVAFELDGQEFVALNGGPVFKFTEAISLVVNCETQDEIDHYWEKLSAGGQQVQCGWLKDRLRLVAGRARRVARDARREGSRACGARDGRRAADDEDRDQRTARRREELGVGAHLLFSAVSRSSLIEKR